MKSIELLKIVSCIGFAEYYNNDINELFLECFSNFEKYNHILIIMSEKSLKNFNIL